MSIFLKMWNATEKRQMFCEEQFLWAARQLNQKEEVHTEFFMIFFAKISISILLHLCEFTRCRVREVEDQYSCTEGEK